MFRDVRIADLPSTVSLLVMEGFILLPEMSLPLIFTDARSQALLDAAEVSGTYLGLVQERQQQGAGPHFHAVGCLARIEALDRRDEGYRVTLEGVIRFRLLAELAGGPGEPAQATVAYEDFARDLDRSEEELPGWNLEAFKQRLLELGRSRSGGAGVLETMTPRQVIRFMAQTIPFSPAERQALLEAPGFRQLLETLVRLLALNYLTSTPDGSPPERAN